MRPPRALLRLPSAQSEVRPKGAFAASVFFKGTAGVTYSQFR